MADTESIQQNVTAVQKLWINVRNINPAKIYQ